ncbi:MAG: glycosyltransferase [Spartobacteria bacterium]|nr:glycosyltransferase [Spartobacteria bacterium]
MKGKRIVFVLCSLHLGGAERQACRLALYLKTHCHADVRVVGYGGRGAVSDFCALHAIPCDMLFYQWDGKFISVLKNRLRLARYLQKIKPVGIMAYLRNACVDCGLVWRFSGARFCVWNQRDAGLELTDSRWERLAVTHSSVIMSNAQHMLDMMRQRYAVDEKKLMLVRNSVELPSVSQHRTAWRRKNAIPQKAFVACMVANYHSFKYHREAISIWKEVVELAGSHGVESAPCLVMAGKDHHYVDDLKNYAAALHVPDSVLFFLDFVEDVENLYEASDMCLFYSKSEGCPNAVLEAMSSGLAVVGTDIPGIREAVGPMGEELLFPVDDFSSAASCIFRLLKDKVRLNRFGSIMKKRAASEFESESNCKKAAECLSVLSGGKGI